MTQLNLPTGPARLDRYRFVQRQPDVSRARHDELTSDVLATLSEIPKRLNSKHLYDEPGSALFDQICDLPEYYLTRSEQSIMRLNIREMVDAIGPDAILMELGSGSSLKTRLLLDHLDNLRAYLPVDISADHVLATARRLRGEYPALEVDPIVGDFTGNLEIPPRFSGERVCVYFPGSTIGNFCPPEARRLLQVIADRCGNDGGLLIGFDLQKDRSVLESAYNDSQGITAAFSLNLLHRLNRESDATFDIDHFRHVAFYNPLAERIEIYLESDREQIVRVADTVFSFSEGERIQTEYSHKYTVAGFAAMAAQVGLIQKQIWMDKRNFFAVMYLEPNRAD